MNSENVVTIYGQCRCCLSNGYHRDIMKEYRIHGKREIYFDMFIECFNLFLSTNSGMGTLICSNCIQRLQDADSFKDLVIRSERTLMKGLDAKEMTFVNVPSAEVASDKHIKQEFHETVPKTEPIDYKDEWNNEYDQHSDFDEEPPLKKSKPVLVEVEVCEELVEGERELVSRFDRSDLRLPTRKTLHETCWKYAKYLDELKGKIVRPKMIEKLLNTFPKKASIRKSIYVTEKLALVTNVETILECSNVVPFKPKSCSGIPCYYCRKLYENRQDLEAHQLEEHTKPNCRRLFTKYGNECFVLYVDITNLKCKLCEESVPNLNDLKTHLINKHQRKFYMEFPDRIIPFKLDNTNGYECQKCGHKFETFGSLERHMNTHYRNFVCEECGTGFITKHRLKVHIKSTHECGTFPCDICKKVYNTQQKYRSHFDSIHRLVKKNKCPKCPLKFTDYFVRQKHMVDVHNAQPLQYKCNVCDKTYHRRYALSCHMKRSHLEDKHVQCQLCAYKCYTNSELKVHMIKHNGERTFECQVCRKSYARKKTLKEHMRIHNNDRRFVCVVCGQAFVQNCSLKGHMKTHHQDYLDSLPIQ